MLSPPIIAGLLVGNVLLLIVAVIAIRLIRGENRDRPRRQGSTASTDDLFAFDSWSADVPARSAGSRPRTADRQPGRFRS